jgi:hypothetical protein
VLCAKTALMKKIITKFFLVVLFIFAMTSCKKNSSSGSSKYYMKFKANDSLITWSKFVIAEIVPDLSDTSMTDFDLSSGSNNQDTTLSLDINVHGKTLPAGTYASTDNSFSMYVEYNLNNNSSNVLDFEVEDANGMPPSTFTIIITSVTAKEIRGTFTGNYLTNPPSGNTVSITEGEFFAPIAPF